MSSNNHVKHYRGRFAPSPTGPLHFGSLVAAVASYLQAKSNQGIWLVRIEDLDPPREMPGAVDTILRSLEKHGLYWDEAIEFQSQRHDIYHAVLENLNKRNLTYACICSRKDISELQDRAGISVYPGTCRNYRSSPKQQHAIRLKTENVEIGFDDRIMGRFCHNMDKDVGDFVLRRADGRFAYQLAVVVDDAEQAITEVVRGSDLLDNTPRQIYLQQLLELPQPTYAHVPIASNRSGEKLSKQTFAKALDDSTPATNLLQALEFLGQNPPIELAQADLENVWQWAQQSWDLDTIPKVAERQLDI